MAKRKWFQSTKGQFIIVVLVFAVIGGGYLAFKSFAASTSGSYVEYLGTKNVTKATGVKTINDNVPSLGKVSVSQLDIGASLTYASAPLKGNTYSKECYILRNSGTAMGRVQLNSGKNSVERNLPPGPNYQRICVAYDDGSSLPTDVKGGYFNVKNISPYVARGVPCVQGQPCANDLKPLINVWVDEQIYTLPDPVGDMISLSGKVTNDSCAPRSGSQLTCIDTPTVITVNGYSITLGAGNITKPCYGQINAPNAKSYKGLTADIYGVLTSKSSISICNSESYFANIHSNPAPVSDNGSGTPSLPVSGSSPGNLPTFKTQPLQVLNLVDPQTGGYVVGSLSQ